MMDESKERKSDHGVDPELEAMYGISRDLDDLSPEARARVLQWAAQRYGVTLSNAVTQPGGTRGTATSHGANGDSATATWTDLAELFAAAAPEQEVDKVLVACYWLQFCEGRDEFTSQDVNSELKHLGYPVKNITSAFDTLKARKPAPVMQLKKSGTSKQARKTLRLTVAGKQAVEMMVGQQQSV